MSISPPDEQDRQRTFLCLGALVLDLAGSRDAVLWVSSLDSQTKSGVGPEEGWVQIRSAVLSALGLKLNKIESRGADGEQVPDPRYISDWGNF